MFCAVDTDPARGPRVMADVVDVDVDVMSISNRSDCASARDCQYSMFVKVFAALVRKMWKGRKVGIYLGSDTVIESVVSGYDLFGGLVGLCGSISGAEAFDLEFPFLALFSFPELDPLELLSGVAVPRSSPLSPLPSARFTASSIHCAIFFLARSTASMLRSALSTGRAPDKFRTSSSSFVADETSLTAVLTDANCFSRCSIRSICRCRYATCARRPRCLRFYSSRSSVSGFRHQVVRPCGSEERTFTLASADGTIGRPRELLAILYELFFF